MTTPISIFYITSSGETEITGSVMYSSAWFESQLGAQPGQFEITCKDPDQVLSFSTGNRVRLEVGGVKMFGGFVFQVTKKFAFAVDDTVTDGPEGVETRLWTLRGVDYNILFDKRFLLNVADPTARIPPSSSSSDAAILQLMTSSYLDLSTDDIDTSTHVFNVGDPAPQGPYGFNSVGTPWRREMLSLTAKTGAIFYLAPGSGSKEIDLYLRGREVVTPGWGFSDTPDGVSTFGFRELDFTEDVSNLVNDALVWGGNQFGATGVTGELVFGRKEDAASIAALFRSQRAEQKFGDSAYLTNADAQTRANIIVTGTADGTGIDPGAGEEDASDPARGLKEPQKFIRLSWFDSTVPTVLIPGAVVTVYLNSFADVYTLPVRSIRIRFENLHPDGEPIIRYDGFLGIQTDDPFTLWQYMAGVASSGGTGSSGTNGAVYIAPTSNGTSPAATRGTLVAMTPSPVPDGTTTAFTVADAYQGGSLKVWMNGLLQRPGIEYVETSPAGKTFTFYDAPLVGDQLWVSYTSGV